MSANAMDTSEHRASYAYSSRFELYYATDAAQASVTQWTDDCLTASEAHARRALTYG